MLSTLLAAPALFLAVLPMPGEQLDHAQLAAQWMKAHAIDPGVVPEEQAEMDALVRGSSVAIEIGGVRLLLPPEEAGHARVVAAFDTLLDVHELWASWTTEGEPEQKLPKDVAAARKRIDKWVGKSLSSALAQVSPGQELFASVDLDDERLAKAFDDWNGWIRTSAGERVAGGARGELMLLPTRKSFVQFACFLGHALPELRATYWAPDIANWSALDYYSTRVSPLSYAAPDAGDFTAEYPMDTKNKDGLRQHVALMGARTLIDAALGDGIDPMFTGGLANLAVIDLFDSVDTKVDGDRRSNTTQGRSVFVPAFAGGRSAGGSLPPVSAESRWRAERGKQYFLRQLRAAQKQASKRVEDKEARHRAFMLESDGGADQLLIETPLLHPSVASLKVEEAFVGDYAEMVRAYRVGFLHWLRDESSKGSNAEFARFLTALAEAPPEEDAAEGDAIEAAAAEDAVDPFSVNIVATYAIPLSARTPTDADLEGRFLRWLAK